MNLKPETLAVILNQPRYSENIGSAARAMLNMGLNQLIVVNPKHFDLEKAAKLATHEARPILESIVFRNDLTDALDGFDFIAGTTARKRGNIPAVYPKEAARTIASLLSNNKVALVFGPEDRGLTNEESRLCNLLITIPSAGFSSLNLSQAVMILCYEIYISVNEIKTASLPRLAGRHELSGMYRDIHELMTLIGHQYPENPDFWMDRARNFLNRFQLQAGEAGMIRSVIQRIVQYCEIRHQEGMKASRMKE